MTAFLASTTAQDRFIGQALDLMVRRSADGANLDFEPVCRRARPPASSRSSQRFGKAMRARIPGASSSWRPRPAPARRSSRASCPLVDQMFVMTYNYRWSGSTIAGAMAPLDNTTRTVKIHISRYLTRAPASKIIMGIGYYGYDWPVTSPVANARGPAQRLHPRRRVERHATPRSGRGWPPIPRSSGTRTSSEGSGWFTYYDADSKSDREVYFEDEFSVARQGRLRDRDRPGRGRHLDARQRRRLPPAVERPARQVLRAEPPDHDARRRPATSRPGGLA